MAGKSSRELRREQERKDRHEAKMSRIDAVSKMSPSQYARMMREKEVIARIQRNGVTLADLKENYDMGYQDGYKAGSTRRIEPIMKMSYAAICLALNELHGFGTNRIRDLLVARRQELHLIGNELGDVPLAPVLVIAARLAMRRDGDLAALVEILSAEVGELPPSND